MRTRNISAAFAAHFSRRRISRVLAVVLSVTLFQFTAGIQSPIAIALPGNVGQDTTNGTCSAAVVKQRVSQLLLLTILFVWSNLIQAPLGQLLRE